MKKTSELTLLTFFMSILSTFAALPNIVKYNATIVSSIKAQKIKIDIEVPKTEIKNINQTSLFLTSIGRRESSNRYDIVNRWGYMGKYQFGRKTLNALGYKNISNKQFLSNPKLQEEAMVKLLKHNKHILRKEIRKYCGTQKHGVYITESGLLAAAHLAGPGNVKKWLRRGKRFRDGLGTDLTEYLQLFGGYKIVI
tara:strand:- start:932 stop:1519 length:588 start_codon:yes stop_codon:yes gene_type:complete